MSDNVLSETDTIEATKADVGGKPSKRVTVDYLDFVKGIEDKDAKDTFEIIARKAIGSDNVAQHRLVNLVPGQGLLRNEETVFKTICEMNPVVVSTDIQNRIRERRVGSGDAEFFRAHNGSLPGGRNSERPFRTNTIGFAGNVLDIPYVPQELVGQSPVEQVDLVAEEVADELAVLNRFINGKLLKNTEITSEVAATGTEPGGFIDRSILYNITTAGDLTNPLIQGRIDAIANNASNEGLGYSRPLVALCREGQIAKIRDLMIARYPGETSTSYMATMTALRARLAEVGIAEDQMAIYKPDPGRPVIFLLESQLPDGHCIFFDPRLVQIIKMRMFGQLGAWALERPTSAITTLMLVFDAFSLSDKLVESRAVIKGLND